MVKKASQKAVKVVKPAMKVIDIVATWIDKLLPVLILVALFGLGGLWLTVKHDEHKTCEVQSAALPANKHLAKAMGDIGFLLQPPEGSEQAKNTALLPKVFQEKLKDLRAQGFDYQYLQSKVPGHRSC